jgi:MoaA/NifB/PqqE/SkfB family radical SAM enzyme
MNCCFIPLEYPNVRVQWDITNKCNLSCKHCCVNKNEVINKDISKNDCIGVIEKLKSLNVKKVTISGGEPFLEKKILLDVLPEFSKKNITVGFVSNLFWDYEYILPMLDYADTITTSIDGLENDHNAVRGKDCFKVTCSNIEKIVKRGQKIKVICTINTMNFMKLKQVINILIDLGVQECMFAYLSIVGEIKNNISLVLNSQETCIAEKCISELRQEYRNKIDIKTSTCMRVKNPNDKDINNICLGGRKIFYLRPDYTVHPCHLFNIKEPISILSDDAIDKISKSKWFNMR